MQVNKKLLRRAMNLSASRGDDGPDCSSIPKLALAAQVSRSAIGFLVTDGKSSRDTCTVDLAHRIADAVGWDVDELFVERRLPTRRVITGGRRATRTERLAALEGLSA